MAYSEDYRRRAVEYYQSGNHQAAVKEVFKIYPSTLGDCEARYESGSLKPSYPKPGKPRKLPSDELKAYVATNPDAFLSEIGEHFGCSAEAVRKALLKLKITLKKRQPVTKNGAKPNVPNTSKI
jgi:transposase